MHPAPPSDRSWKRVISWSLYDWANSAFATTVMAGLFPIFFKSYWHNEGVSDSVATARLGYANSVAGLIVVVMAPVLGAIADQSGARKRFLCFFAMLGALMTAGLFAVPSGGWIFAGALYTLGIIGFSGGNVFYDALLPSVAGERRLDFVSALGYALGYLGGGLLFALNVWMVTAPHTFGLPDQDTAVRVSFVCVGVWWAAFSLPVLLVVPEPLGQRRTVNLRMVRAGFAQLAETFRHVRQLRVAAIFLLAYWLYIDGVDTIIRMAVSYGVSLGFPSDSLIKALLITQLVGFPAAVLYGKFGERIGPKNGILTGIAVYIGVTIYAVFLDSEREFYVLAVVIGLVQGGVQSLSRSLFARLVPADKTAEFFGFYNMLGKFAAVIGPALVGWVGEKTDDPRLGILSILLLFVSGGALLCFVRTQRGKDLAAGW